MTAASIGNFKIRWRDSSASLRYILPMQKKDGLWEETAKFTHTKNGGNKRELQNSGTKDDLRDVCYDGGIHLYAVGAWGTILTILFSIFKIFGGK